MSTANGYTLVTAVYCDAKRYEWALVVEASRWSGREVLPEVQAWCGEALRMLTAPQSRLSMDGDVVVVSNGKGQVALLDLTAA